MQSLFKNKRFQQTMVLLLVAVSIFWIGFILGTGDIETSIEANMRGFSLILWSILLEAMPFVLLGTIISSLIQVFVTQDMILRVLPKNQFLRLVFSALIGLIFPVCECAIIPITRGLLKKGMPAGPAIAFMLATPIVNPIVLFSTYNAFPTMPQMMLFRAGFGFAGAVLIGALLNKVSAKKVLLSRQTAMCGCGCDHDHQQEHHHSHASKQSQDTCSCRHTEHHPHGLANTIKAILAHTSAELRSVGMYLIFGAVITAAVQMFVPANVLTGLGSGRIISIIIMMLLAFVLSLCSEADAFVANTFLLQFSGASVLAFLIVGPMIDIKNTFMMFGSFQKRFTIRLMITILLVCFALAVIASFVMGGSYV